MPTTNTIEQETATRHAGLLSEILAVMYRHSDPFGNQWVEVIDDTKLRLHTRYHTTAGVYQITQTMRLETVPVLL